MITMADNGNGYTIENIAMHGKFLLDDGDEIDIPSLNKFLEGKSYVNKLLALVYKSNGGSDTMMLYKTGSFVVTGVTSIKGGTKLVSEMRDILADRGITPRDTETKVSNMVGCGDIGFEIDLDKFIYEVENTQYEPEVFPGVIYRPESDNGGKKPKPTFLVFKSGKFVCAGLKDEDDMKKWIHDVKQSLKTKDIKL